MADTPPALSDLRVAFLRDHITPVPAHEVTGRECCFCLDSFATEVAVRIDGIPGCTHVFGADCIQAFINNSPGEAKTCPFCRALWIPSQDELLMRDAIRHLSALANDSRVRLGQTLFHVGERSGFYISTFPTGPGHGYQEPEPVSRGRNLRPSYPSGLPRRVLLGREGEGSQERGAETVATQQREIEDIRDSAGSRRQSRPPFSNLVYRIGVAGLEPINGDEEVSAPTISQQVFAGFAAAASGHEGPASSNGDYVEVSDGESDENEVANDEAQVVEPASVGLPETTGLDRRNRFDDRSNRVDDRSNRFDDRPNRARMHGQSVYLPTPTASNRRTPQQGVPNQVASEMYRIEGFRRDMEERISERRDQVSGRQAHTIEERQNQILEMFRQVQQRETMVTLRENGMLERHFQRRDAEPDVD